MQVGGFAGAKVNDSRKLKGLRRQTHEQQQIKPSSGLISRKVFDSSQSKQ